MKLTRKSSRARRTPAQWSTLVQRYHDSALTQTAFCKAQGLALSSFTKALRESRASVASGASAQEFVPVLLDDAEPSNNRMAWDVELELGAGVVLRIRGA